jgi:hypothetical protein
MKQKDMLRSVLRSPLSRACSSEIFCRKRIQNCRFVQLHTASVRQARLPTEKEMLTGKKGHVPGPFQKVVS